MRQLEAAVCGDLEAIRLEMASGQMKLDQFQNDVADVADALHQNGATANPSAECAVEEYSGEAEGPPVQGVAAHRLDALEAKLGLVAKTCTEVQMDNLRLGLESLVRRVEKQEVVAHQGPLPAPNTSRTDPEGAITAAAAVAAAAAAKDPSSKEFSSLPAPHSVKRKGSLVVAQELQSDLQVLVAEMSETLKRSARRDGSVVVPNTPPTAREGVEVASGESSLHFAQQDASQHVQHQVHQQLQLQLAQLAHRQAQQEHLDEQQPQPQQPQVQPQQQQQQHFQHPQTHFSPSAAYSPLPAVPAIALWGRRAGQPALRASQRPVNLTGTPVMQFRDDAGLGLAKAAQSAMAGAPTLLAAAPAFVASPVLSASGPASGATAVSPSGVCARAPASTSPILMQTKCAGGQAPPPARPSSIRIMPSSGSVVFAAGPARMTSCSSRVVRMSSVAIPFDSAALAAPPEEDTGDVRVHVQLADTPEPFLLRKEVIEM